MKKYLFIALAALGLAACAEKMDDNSIPNGELEEAYIAINLMSADANTRAAEDEYGYEDGTDVERKITNAYFFFFDDSGEPFNVTASAPGGDKNHLQLTIGNTTGKVDPNISDIKEAILILNTYKGVYPSKIVAVLNWVPSANTYTLGDLHTALASVGNDEKGYVMSNSVYMDMANNVIDAVPLTAANIKTTPEAAKNAPIDIYVERIAAKVVLTASGKVNSENIFKTEKSSSMVLINGSSSSVEVYVKLHGWELYNDFSTSHLLKNIQNWNVVDLGLTWNDIPYYRSYWASSQVYDSSDDSHKDSFAWSYTEADKNLKGFQTTYGFNVASSDQGYIPYSNRTTYTYCGENTNQKSGTTDPRTKVILKGQLMQKKGDNYESLELARWYGTEYAGEEALRIAVANSLRYTLFNSEDGINFHPVTQSDLQCVEGSSVGVKSYEVGFQLTTESAKKTWYQYSSTGGYSKFGDAAVSGDNAAKANVYLKTIEPALLYGSGNTYYIVDIEHLGTSGAKYGVVRNHVYQIDIQSIKGYGTPVYIGTSNIVTPPEYPVEDESSYVAARINVLSWKVVKQGVDVK